MRSVSFPHFSALSFSQYKLLNTPCEEIKKLENDREENSSDCDVSCNNQNAAFCSLSGGEAQEGRTESRLGWMEEGVVELRLRLRPVLSLFRYGFSYRPHDLAHSLSPFVLHALHPHGDYHNNTRPGNKTLS